LEAKPRLQLRRVREAGGGDQLGQGLHGVLVEVRDPVDLVRHHQRALAQFVLGGHAARAAVGVAALRLGAGRFQEPTATLS